MPRMNRGSLRLPPLGSSDVRPPGHRLPSDADEEEAMLQEAIRLSLGQGGATK